MYLVDAAASQYGVRSMLQSKGVIKSAVWTSFAETLSLYWCLYLCFNLYFNMFYNVHVGYHM